MSEKLPVLLVVDDDHFNRLVIKEMLDGQGYELIFAKDGEEAWDSLQSTPSKFDAVLLDRMMPGINGMEVLRRIKGNSLLKLLPVIMQTAASSTDQIAEGLNAGAFYYLTKPFKVEVLRAVVANAIRDRNAHVLEIQQLENQLLGLQHLEEGTFSFRTIEEGRQAAAILSALCPAPITAHMGLMELILNAIEHGNLGISYEEKTQLIIDDALQSEVSRRLALPEYADKVGTVTFKRMGKSLMFTVIDQGKGFDWHPYLEMSIDRIMHNHGRGIAMSRSLCFADLEYRGSGNCVKATIIA